MKKKLTSLIMVTSFLFLMFFGLAPATADDPGPDCDIIVSSGEAIQDAIDVAAEGDVICVELGTYEEDLIIEKGLELVGLKDTDDDANRPIIEGLATVPGDQFPLAAPNIDIRADNVSIHGFIIKSPGVTADEYSSGIVLTGRNIQIYDNLFFVATGDVSQAIQTWRQNNAPEGLRDISGLRIFKNRFTHLEPAIGLGAYEGIFINPQSEVIDLSEPDSAVRIEKNKFSGALIRAITTQRSGTVIQKNRMTTDWVAPAALSSFPRGIQLSKAGSAPPLPDAASTHHQVLKNRINDGGDTEFSVGILMRDFVTDCTIEKNAVIGASNNGIELGSSDSNRVKKNFITFSGNDGLLVNGDGNLLIKNFIKESGRYGLHLDASSENNFAIKNKIKKSGDKDIFDAGTGNIFEKNRCAISDPEGLCR